MENERRRSMMWLEIVAEMETAKKLGIHLREGMEAK